MKVYVLERNECSDDREIAGVFATAERAMTTWSPRRPDVLKVGYSYTWKPTDGGWEFEGRDTDWAMVTEYEVEP